MMAVKTVILLLCYIGLFMMQAFKYDSFMSESFDYSSQNGLFSEGVPVPSPDHNQEAWPRQHQMFSVSCGKDAVQVVLPSGSLSEVKILGMLVGYSILVFTLCILWCPFYLVFLIFVRFLHLGLCSRSKKRMCLLSDKGTRELCSSCQLFWLLCHC